jgi:uncharacterized membrane protein SpoIIM required for sporulation
MTFMQDGAEKIAQWTKFHQRAQRLLGGGKRALRGLPGVELARLLDDYQAIVADLARARSLGAAPETVDQLNRIAIVGHNLLYGQLRMRDARPGAWRLSSFARAVRRYAAAVAFSALLFFGSALGAFIAVHLQPTLGYDLLGDEFLEFDPARPDNLHDIPSLARPVISSLIISNNIQVTLLAFGFGLTAGIGTAVLLVLNGIHLGTVASWLMLQGNGRALWGWIMPHGGTELLAICLAGGAGFILATAILAPGRKRRTTALRQVGADALTIELGCMVMLVIAGLIEGFISPSNMPYTMRIGVLAASLIFWGGYFMLAGRRVGEAIAAGEHAGKAGPRHESVV